MMQVTENEHVHAVVYQVNKLGKSCCGDSFYIKADEHGLICAVADGLGSGKFAQESSSTIMQIVEEFSYEEMDTIFERCNQALKNKRGATVSILKVDFISQTFTYSSVGNVRFLLSSPSGQYTYPLPVLGYLSGKPQKYKTQTYTYETGSKFIIYTDGLEAPGIRTYLRQFNTVSEISNKLKCFTQDRKDDLTYVVGQLL